MQKIILINNPMELIAGETIFKYDKIEVVDGVAYRKGFEHKPDSRVKKEPELWETLGYDSESQAIETIKGNIPTIVQRTSKFNK